MKNNIPIRLFLLSWSLLFITNLVAQEEDARVKEDVYVDEEGVMRWEHNNSPVKGFGVNYSVPFAHAYRTGKRLDVELKEAIDNDVYHFSRLGFDLYRIHIWDTEISDEAGNLLKNEHLELFDYLISQLKERNINFVLTPIAYWGNGWPEPDEDTPGFSDEYGKAKSLTNPEAIKAQENYLAQFLNHVNPYTGIAYKNEPNVIAFEISNEPHHREGPEKVKEFINRMVTALRSTGTDKPIFYNVSHSIHLAETYAASKIDGGTFQWYPTGLGFGKELEGNLLPNVNDYEIPFDEIWLEEGLAKLVYEFDAADVMKSYIYPALARSFRQAGIQLATHFAYDPTFMSYANTEYNTHYMNLAYTPQKALALMISGEVFHQLPMYEDLGGYPDNFSFGDFLISYGKDLALLNSEEKFFYTNSNTIKPESLVDLMQIAGYGNSEVVKYKGRGAYFLDKLADGVWRLELMPDALVVRNPFGQNSLDKTIAVINHKPWEMKVNLPGLGADFLVSPLNQGNGYSTRSKAKSFIIEPGSYILKAEGKEYDLENDGQWEEDDLKAYVAPKTTVDKTYVLHEAVPTASVGTNLEISAEIISNEEIEKVEVWFRNGNIYNTAVLKPQGAYNYVTEVPEKLLKKGFLNYRIVVTTQQGSFTFPSGVEGNPAEWDFYDASQYRTAVVEPDYPVYLFNAAKDSENVVGEWMESLKIVPTKDKGEAEYQVNVEKLFEEDVENLNADPLYDYSFRYNFNRKIAGRRADLSEKDELVLKGRALNNKPVKLQVAFVMNNGSAFGEVIELQPGELDIYEVDLSDLKPVKTVILPRPYPSFLPYYFEHNLEEDFDLQNVESLQFSIGPGIPEGKLEEQHGVGIVNVRLQ